MTMPDISLTSWAAIAAGAAFIGSTWRQISTWLSRLSDLVICRAMITGDAAKAVSSHVWQHGRRSPFAVRSFSGARSFVRPKKRIEVIGFEALSASAMLFWIGRAPLVVKRGGIQMDDCHYSGTANDNPLSVWFIRGTLDMDQLIEQGVASYNQSLSAATQAEGKPRRRFNVRRVGRSSLSGSELTTRSRDQKDSLPVDPSGSQGDLLKRVQSKEVRLLTWTPDELIEQGTDQPPFDLYPFPAATLDILPRIERWIAHETWFRSKGIPWRMGVLCTGLPGTGKSTFVRSVAIRFDLPLYVFDLSALDNASFTSEWREVQQNTPAIVLLEDLDAVFRGREFVAKVAANRDTLTFDCLLNTISGVGSSDGVLLFVTTNHAETLDPALGHMDTQGRSTRPGRIDQVIEFGAMEEAERRKLAAFILADYPEDIGVAVAAGEGETAAQFQDRCGQLALDRWREGKEPKGVEEPPPHPPSRPTVSEYVASGGVIYAGFKGLKPSDSP